MKRLYGVLLCLMLLAVLPSETAEAEEAKDISGMSLVTDSQGFQTVGGLFDGGLWGRGCTDEGSLTLGYPEGIGSLYLIFFTEYAPYTVTNNDTGESRPLAEQGFLHDFVDLEGLFGKAPSSVTLTFDKGRAEISELYAYTSGQVPETVQKWNQPKEGQTDLALFSTHGDDEQIYFAGLLPYYAGELGYQVQVIYLTDHRNSGMTRVHEMLNGLWSVGVTTYPVFGYFEDLLCHSLEEAYRQLSIWGHPKEELLSFVVEQLRRFHPLVAVGHDFKGEYGHGQHMLYADLLAQAIDISNDETAFPESAEKYGLWEVPKTYFHLYEDEAITMDWDLPLERFGGLTAYEVCKIRGFPCHASQQYPQFVRQLSFNTAAEVDMYSPCAFGLYRSTVGADEEKQDFFENLLTYDQQRQAEEKRAREEERVRIDAIRERKRAVRQEYRRQIQNQRRQREIETSDQPEYREMSVVGWEKMRTGSSAAGYSRRRANVWALLVGMAVVAWLGWRSFREENYRKKL